MMLYRPKMVALVGISTAKMESITPAKANFGDLRICVTVDISSSTSNGV